MSFTLNGVEIPSSTYNQYILNTINKIFKILPIYEECLAKKNFTSYESYLEKTIVMLTGSEILFNKKDFLPLIATLKGMEADLTLPKKQVKSLVFHCISILEKLQDR